MTEQAKLERRTYMREYMREYRKKNKSKIAEIQESYWERKAQNKEKDFINNLMNDNSLMSELKSEKLTERAINEDLEPFYVDDLVKEIITDIERKI